MLKARKIQELAKLYLKIANDYDNLKTTKEYKKVMEREEDLANQLLMLLQSVGVEGINKNNLFIYALELEERGYLDKIIS